MATQTQYEESAAYLRARLHGFTPEFLMILGSGLGELGDMAENAVAVSYEEIPHFKTSTAPSHRGRLLFGMLAGRRVAVMQGRTHYYEGYSFADVSFPVRVLRLLGAETLVVTNAAGGVNTSFHVGDIMLITDHIKFFDESPLRGPNIPAFGARFSDMSFVYSPALRETARRAAAENHMVLREGVYFYMPGPQYETPAEIRAIRTLGGDTVGMSTVPEVITAAHAGMNVLGFSLVSNMAAGILPKPLTEQEVIEAGKAAKEKFSALLLGCLRMAGSL